jgi:TM2 domain-containing membrane protein YozV
MFEKIFPPDRHTIVAGYFLWIFGFTGAHRFYFGKQVTGALWFLTFGMMGIGWIVDLFLIPGMEKDAEIKFVPGKYNYNIAWFLLTYFGFLGFHRMYLGKWVSGILYFFTAGWLTFGWLYDLWNLNKIVSDLNQSPS